MEISVIVIMLTIQVINYFQSGGVFPMVIWPEFRRGQYRHDHREDAPTLMTRLQNPRTLTMLL